MISNFKIAWPGLTVQLGINFKIFVRKTANYSPFAALTMASIFSGGAIAGMEQPLERIKL